MNKEIINLKPWHSLVLFEQHAEGLQVKWAASTLPSFCVWCCSGKRSPALGFRVSGRNWLASAMLIGLGRQLPLLTFQPSVSSLPITWTFRPLGVGHGD